MNSYGLVFGGEKTSHDSGNDIAYNVVSGNDYTKVVIEGDEYILPKEAMQSEKVYDFVDKLPIEMLDEIKRSENVFIQFPNLRQGDMVVCKNSVRNDDLHTIKGTAKEIGNYLQGLSACRMYAKGGYISGELANGGGVEDESQLRLLTPMPPTKLGKTGIDSLTEIIGKNEMRPALSGALYAGKGIIVATDANILVVLENQNYPKSFDGTIKSLWNKVPQENLVGVRYPTWEVTIPSQQNFQTKELSIDDVLVYAYGGFLEGKKIINEKDFNKYQKERFKYILRLNIGNIEIGVDSLLLTRILRTLKANDVRKIVFHIGQTNQRPIKITTDNKHYGLIMPVMIADKVEDLGEAIYVSQQIFYPISEKDFRAMSKKYGEYLTEFSKMVGGERMAQGGEITMNMPLLIRVLELAKEDVKEDKEIHFIAERLQSIADKGTLTMEDYDYISGLESNDKIQKLIAENDSNDSDLRFEQGGEIEDLISRGIVDLKMFDTTPKHAKEYGLQCLNPLFVQTICVSEPKRLKGLGTKVLSYIEKYAIENGHDLIFGHITEKAKFTKDQRKTFFCDIDMIKNWLHSNGYAINDENNDFHKVIQSNKLEGGGSVLLAPNGKPSNLTPEQWHLVRTPEFKAWFGDWEALENAKTRDKGMDEVTLKNLASSVSKVVDENGEPLVVYHFSNMDFNVFELKGLSDGFFFTKNFEDEEFSQKGWLKSMGLTIEQSMEKGYDLKYEKGKPYFLNIKQFYIKENVKNSLWSTPYFENVVIEFAKRNKTNDGVEFLREIDNKQIVVAFYPEQIKLADGSNTTFDSNNPDIRFEKGGKLNPSKTPAPIKERVYGSKINKPKSSASLRSASAIKLSSENISTLNKKVLEFKSKYTNRNKRMTLNALKAVMRRGMGAYSSTHRPTISGGKPNSRVAWGLARVNAFLFKAENGRPKNPKYVQDDDLLRELGYKFAMQMGGVVYLPELYDFDESELKKGGEISPEKFDMPNKEVLEYGDFLKKNYPKAWKAGGNIFGNQAFENLKRVSNRGYWLESERWMYEKWQSFVKRHQHNHLLAGVIANVKWASWGNIGKAKAKSVIENAFSEN